LVLQRIIDQKKAPFDIDSFLANVAQRLRNVSENEISDRKIMLEYSEIPEDLLVTAEAFLQKEGYDLHYNFCYEKYFVCWSSTFQESDFDDDWHVHIPESGRHFGNATKDAPFKNDTNYSWAANPNWGDDGNSYLMLRQHEPHKIVGKVYGDSDKSIPAGKFCGNIPSPEFAATRWAGPMRDTIKEAANDIVSFVNSLSCK
jgi:hypothetical protein